MAFLETLVLLNLVWIGWTYIGMKAVAAVCNPNPPLRVILERDQTRATAAQATQGTQGTQGTQAPSEPTPVQTEGSQTR